MALRAAMTTRVADAVLYTRAGPEIGVASTKAFTTQLTCLYLLALHLGQLHGKVTDAEARQDVQRAGQQEAGWLECALDLESFAEQGLGTVGLIPAILAAIAGAFLIRSVMAALLRASTPPLVDSVI